MGVQSHVLPGGAQVRETHEHHEHDAERLCCSDGAKERQRDKDGTKQKERENETEEVRWLNLNYNSKFRLV